ncbi:MAG: LysE family translocator [Boseongicola sp. SB0676_bin_33]|nr:LysE family translocator [Boseongicola sp. SB0676_bin_33]MYK30233.1 LysE family translocator [Boseongicola sp. SB0670_bin_30]
MASFVLAVFFLIITPGPGVLSLAGVGSAFGYAHGVRYLAGLFVGTNLVCLAVVSGLSALVLADPGIRVVLTVASATYLLWLAFRIAFAGTRIAFIERPSPPGIRGGILLQAVNPKAYVVNTTLFSGFAFMADHPLMEIGVKLFLLNVLWAAIHVAWLCAGVTIRRMNLPAAWQRRINAGMAAAMVAVVALAAIAPQG